MVGTSMRVRVLLGKDCNGSPRKGERWCKIVRKMKRNHVRYLMSGSSKLRLSLWEGGLSLLLLELVLLPTCSSAEPDRFSAHVCTCGVSIRGFFLSELSLKLPIRFAIFPEAPLVENRFPLARNEKEK